MFALVGERLYRLASKSNAPAIIDNLTFRLHYGVATLALFMCAVLATSSEHFGTPIECVSSSAPSSLPRQALTTFCWIHGTFTLDPDIDSYAAHPGVFKYIPNVRSVHQIIVTCLQARSMFHFKVFLNILSMMKCIQHYYYLKNKSGKIIHMFADCVNNLAVKASALLEKRYIALWTLSPLFL